ncbi:hypothetical protein XBFFL1_2260094 [Xenorhabdus bovienii str. feltiae Florida]|uniref:Uncharacterized protein n=1 Tax=Xenorhabdus bovienii TaxID=40576 RepID=A0A0B6XBA2_XENBV|nr:hypothetical protein XBFFR1_1870090 [Xenorhabdus bovienii str. feltiae France]CDG92669.1 hypothetical protein XBFFL1_2260094 [Xenorhabdus bovienii str. feltiae Florida]CDM90456.1 protein of unknown function [Xenorhabdus bovienii]
MRFPVFNPCMVPARFRFKRRCEINYKDSLSLRNHQSQRLNYENFVVYIFANKESSSQSDKFLADRANWDLKAHLSGNAHLSDNSLIFNQTTDLASACPAPCAQLTH